MPRAVAAVTVMVNVLGGDRPDLYEAYKHVQARDPAIRVHMRDFLKAIDERGKPVADIEQGHISTASCILANMSQALGRSLAYPRAVFDAVGGFARHAHTLSGDDDLFVQDVVRARAARVVHAVGTASLVPSDAPATLGCPRTARDRLAADGRGGRRGVRVGASARVGL